MRQRLRRAAPEPAGAGYGSDVGGGTAAGAAPIGIGLPAVEVPHTVQKAVPSSSAVPH